jgi:hypothetical protein
LEKTESKLNPTAHFPSVYTAGNTFSKNAVKHKAKTHYPADKKTVVHSKACENMHANHGVQ